MSKKYGAESAPACDPGALVALAVGPVGIAMAEAPTVTEINPISGTTLGGTEVTINGTGFVLPAKVMIGGVEATPVEVVLLSLGTEIKATTAAHAAGEATVVVEDINGSSTGGPTYTYVTPPPTVTKDRTVLGQHRRWHGSHDQRNRVRLAGQSHDRQRSDPGGSGL